MAGRQGRAGQAGQARCGLVRSEHDWALPSLHGYGTYMMQFPRVTSCISRMPCDSMRFRPTRRPPASPPSHTHTRTSRHPTNRYHHQRCTTAHHSVTHPYFGSPARPLQRVTGIGLACPAEPYQICDCRSPTGCPVWAFLCLCHPFRGGWTFGIHGTGGSVESELLSLNSLSSASRAHFIRRCSFTGPFSFLPRANQRTALGAAAVNPPFLDNTL